MTRDEEDQALETDRFDWDEAYEIGTGLDGFWARRRDGIARPLTDEGPGGLRRQIRDEREAPRSVT